MSAPHTTGARATIAIMLLAGATAALAQSSDDHAGHQGMQATPPAQATPDTPQSGMDHSTMPGMSAPKPATPDAMQGMDHGDMDHGDMDHSTMPGMSKPKPAAPDAMQGMDHDGMDHGKMPGMSAPNPAAPDPMQGMDHGGMDHGEMDHSTMPGVSKPKPAAPDAMQGMDHGGKNHGSMDHSTMPGMSAPKPATPDAMQGMDHDGMDHGDMNMQGGPAPADARDPHAYSGGYTLGDGKYALAGPRQLKMADEHSFANLLVDRLERVDTRDATFTTYDAQAWFGRDYNRFIIKAEGDYADGDIAESSTELLYGHAIASSWDAHVGVRHDTGEGPDRNWLAFGVQGLAPYWFELEATAYIGGNRRTALSLEAEYELLITQRLVLQPRAELAFFGKSDRANGVGSGVADASFGLRLRYEFSRQFAPYVGIEWANKFGQTADFARDEGAPTRETRYVFGVRFWF